ncbi:MAG: CRISPR-associated endonuclease Cas2 [Deltaproteobacteria bacterium]|nr:MAG: CRISPR-associated endonuclease Cas2 [Deltaproteobacteria bacterium]
MGGKTSYVVISYDISDPKRLYKIAKIMKNYATRVLYSVFEGELTWSQEQGMRREVARVLDVEEDSVRYYHLCNRCKERILTNGVKVPVQEEKDFEII